MDNIGYGVEAVLKPNSIAIVGVSGSASKKEVVGGTAILKNLLRFGYTGKIYPINPKYEEIMGCKCFKSIKDVPEIIDLVVIAVGSDGVPALMQECGDAGVKAVNIISSGFAEVGTPKGKELQEKILSIAHTYGMRIVGPNNLGSINLLEKVAASTSAGLYCDKLIAGSIGWVSQSGALTSSLYGRVMDAGIGLAYVVTLGNESDLDMADFIWYMLDDERVKVIAVYIERIKDTEKFKKVALKAMQVGKPIIAMKTGSSERGAAAAMAHTGSLVGSDSLYSAFFKQNGIIRVEGIDELFETAELFSQWSKYGSVENLAVVTTSGGAGGIFADLCEPAGLNMPPLSKDIKDRIMKEIPEYGSAQNPIDMTAQILQMPDALLEVGKILDETSEVDGVLFAISALPPASAVQFAKNIVEYCAHSKKPVVVCWYAGSMNGEAIDIICQKGIPCYVDFEATVIALKRRSQFLKYKKAFADKEDAPVFEQVEVAKSGAFSESESKSFLRKYGVPTTREILANGWNETLNAANEIGYPVVIKIDSADILHKTEADVVRINIKNDAELKIAFEQITQNAKTNKPDAKINGVLVQEMIGGGVEAFIGATYDAQFGPNIVYGLGGIYVEVFKDVVQSMAPVSYTEAMDMIEQTKSAKILKGARGKTYDVQSLAKLLVSVSEVVARLGSQMSELDLNPVIVTKDGVKVVDALLITK